MKLDDYIKKLERAVVELGCSEWFSTAAGISSQTGVSTSRGKEIFDLLVELSDRWTWVNYDDESGGHMVEVKR